MGTAAGLAIGGKLPFVSTFAVFATGRAWEQVRQSICYPNLSVKIVASHAGVTVGEDGGSHQSVEDIAVMRVIPNMTVIVPADGAGDAAGHRGGGRAQGPLLCARRTEQGADALRAEDYQFKIGKAHVFHEGKDAAIIATGIMVAEALKARDLLKAEGHRRRRDQHVHDQAARSRRGDRRGKALRRHRDRGGAFDHRRPGRRRGRGACRITPAPLVRIGVKDTFGTSGDGDGLLKHYGLSADDICGGGERSDQKETVMLELQDRR